MTPGKRIKFYNSKDLANDLKSHLKMKMEVVPYNGNFHLAVSLFWRDDIDDYLGKNDELIYRDTVQLPTLPPKYQAGCF